MWRGIIVFLVSMHILKFGEVYKLMYLLNTYIVSLGQVSP